MGSIRKVIPNKPPQKQHPGTSITTIPRDILSLVTPHLSFRALGAFSLTCTAYSHFTTPSINARKRLLSAVMAANIEIVQECLTNPLNIPMILTPLAAREFNGREWQSVSPLEFAAWAGDRELVTLLLQHLPQENIPEAIHQLETVVMTRLEHGFPLKPFFELSETYRMFSIYFVNDIRLEAEPYCIKAIGGKQAKLPSFCLQLFCDGERFTNASNKSDILYLEALSKLKALGVKYFINKAENTVYIDRFPTYVRAATYCENYIIAFCGEHQNFLTQLIDQLRAELPTQPPAPKKARR